MGTTMLEHLLLFTLSWWSGIPADIIDEELKGHARRAHTLYLIHDWYEAVAAPVIET